MTNEKIRNEVLNGALKCLELGLIHGTSGNISVAIREEDIVIITPTSVPYHRLSPEDLPVVRLSDGHHLSGELSPSKEAPMHLAILRAKPKINAVVHTHSLYATVVSLIFNELPAISTGSAPYSPTRVTPFILPGSEELANAVVDTMGNDSIVCLLKNHGLIAGGINLEMAIDVASYVEENAQVAYLAHLAGHLTPIPEKEYQILHDRALKRMGLL